LISSSKGTFKSFKISLNNVNQAKEAFDIIHPLWKKETVPKQSTLRRQSVKSSKEMDKIFQELPASDWELILSGAKSISLPYGSVILEQGEKYQKMFQINRGVCKAELALDGDKKKVNEMKVGETFGEISFLENNGASVSVIVDSEDGVDLTVVDGYYINTLINTKPHFGANFYKYLAVLLSYRIRQKETK